MNWDHKKVLVTGANGFIGRHVAQDLLEQGAFVVSMVHDASRWDGTPGIKVIEADVGDYERLREIISCHEIEFVFHFAANAIVQVSGRDPLTTYRTNVMGTVNLLEAIRNAGGEKVKGIVAASSDKAYGDHEVLPYKEDFSLQPLNTYDVSKACMDMICRSYAHNYGLPVVVTRCSNVYGPGDPNESRLIPRNVKRIIEGKQPLLYSDVKDMEREFIFIDDVVSAYMAIADHVQQLKGKAVNIGGNGPVSILSVIEIIKTIAGRKDLDIEVSFREPTFKEIKRQCIDSTLLQETTGWYPQWSLEHGLRKLVEDRKMSSAGLTVCD